MEAKSVDVREIYDKINKTHFFRPNAIAAFHPQPRFRSFDENILG